METHLARDLVTLKKKVLSMGGLVEEALRNACHGLVQRDASLADSVPALDREVDQHELEIDDFGLKLLALHQPVAGDLRFIVATLKITNDLERIGDLASNVAERASALAGLPALDEPLAVDEMSEIARGMLRDALDALVSGNSDLARQVCERDDLVDEHNRRIFEALKARMKRDPDSIEAAVTLMGVSRSIERVADLATNIAEDVVFLVEALDIRHPSLDEKTEVPEAW